MCLSRMIRWIQLLLSLSSKKRRGCRRAHLGHFMGITSCRCLRWDWSNSERWWYPRCCWRRCLLRLLGCALFQILGRIWRRGRAFFRFGCFGRSDLIVRLNLGRRRCAYAVGSWSVRRAGHRWRDPHCQLRRHDVPDLLRRLPKAFLPPIWPSCSQSFANLRFHFSNWRSLFHHHDSGGQH